MFNIPNNSAFSVQNSGRIEAGTAILCVAGIGASTVKLSNSGALVGTLGVAVAADARQSASLTNSGLIDGDVQLRSDGAITLTNAGTILGDVFLLKYENTENVRALYNGLGTSHVTGTVYGDVTNDRLFGGAYSDRLNGSNGNDILRGRGDDDDLTGGIGADRLFGGAGADTFIYASAHESSTTYGRDVIADFSRAEDQIDLTALSGAGRFIGEARFSAKGQFEVRAVLNKKTHVTTVAVDENGDGRADMVLALQRQFALLDSDNFLL